MTNVTKIMRAPDDQHRDWSHIRNRGHTENQGAGYLVELQ